MNDPNNSVYKIYQGILQGSILVFTLALVYFAFVYYPKAISTYKRSVPAKQPVIAPVSAISAKLPIETKNYRIVYEGKSDTYFVFVQGTTLDAYLLNKNSAVLTLKSALSLNSLCTLNVIYTSVANLDIPEKYKVDPNCQ